MAKRNVRKRQSKIERKTRETEITITIDLDGQGNCRSETGVSFLDHMLELLAKHGFIDLSVVAKGDLDVDDHHTVEDIGICIGQAIHEAVGDKKGLRRYGFASVPLDEALAQVTVDLSGRAFLVMNADLGQQPVGSFDPDLVHDFFYALAANAQITLHINVLYGRNTHHKIECIFKAFARALAESITNDPRQKGVPSTKGVL
ncbi:MAG: imidazoleglycerol-phosphate dehydratase HisB [Planctomycetota bacterium]|jgi:imidazoleglycerol-phosphate dehydratase|nr:imidazoleglycerol-phosphate dehydratase HisB [Planctomycetota bacterium]